MGSGVEDWRVEQLGFKPSCAMRAAYKSFRVRDFRVYSVGTKPACAVGAAHEDAQEYLAHRKPPPPLGPTVAICLWPYGGPRGEGCSNPRV